ncbi:hypothetical protein [Rufibacter ruber]|uniref:hypothetical protein n=1 Tax=Rufibacter ruber TaxID=1783499 RepID=UPI000836368B|nr:hypothetical protein [Rufibacter ruber]
MNNAYFHLLLNHAPVYTVLFGIVLLLYGLLARNISLVKAGLTSVLVATLLTMPAYFTGEGAEEVVEHLPGIHHADIEAHEQMAEWALWAMGTAGTAALLGLLTTSSRPARARKPKVWAVVTLVVSIGAFALLVWTGLTGGAIRHSELKEVAPPVPQPPAGNP